MQRLLAIDEDDASHHGEGSSSSASSPDAGTPTAGSSKRESLNVDDSAETLRSKARFLVVMEPVRRSRAQLAFDENMDIVWADVEFAKIHSLPLDFVDSVAHASKRVGRRSGPWVGRAAALRPCVLLLPLAFLFSGAFSNPTLNPRSSPT